MRYQWSRVIKKDKDDVKVKKILLKRMEVEGCKCERIFVSIFLYTGMKHLFVYQIFCNVSIMSEG